MIEKHLDPDYQRDKPASTNDNAQNYHIKEDLSQPRPSVRIIEAVDQSEGFQVVKGSNGMDLESSCSNESTDEGMLCGNSQEDPASLDKPLPESVGTIIIPTSETSFITDNGKQSQLNHLTTIEVPKRQFSARNNRKQHNDNESPSEAGSSGEYHILLR